MSISVTLTDDSYPVVGFSEAGVFTYGADQSLANDYAVELIDKGRVVHPATDPVTDMTADFVRDEKHGKIY